MLDKELSVELKQYLLVNYRPEGGVAKHFVEDTPKKSGVFLPILGMAGLFRILQGTDSLVRHLDMSFSEKLMWWIKERKRTPVEIYRAAGVTKAHFAKIRNNPHYHPTKETVLAFVIALHLSVEEAKDLLERAGYALSKSHLGDMIVKCFLEMQRYNIDEINEALYIHDCKLLTNWRESK